MDRSPFATSHAPWLPLLGLIAFLSLAVACSSASSAKVALRAHEGSQPLGEASAPVAIPEPSRTSGAVPPRPTSPLAGHRICLDPGHDPYWVAGATGYLRSGVVPRHPADQVPLFEHELSLSVATRLESLLIDEGAIVCVTRKSREQGGGLQLQPYDFTGDGRVRTAGMAIEDEPERSQPRIDWANAFGAEVLVSIHFNGASDPTVRGTEVYYSDTGARGDAGQRLANAVLAGLLSEMTQSGFAALARGVKSDRYQRYTPEEMRRFLANNKSTIEANGRDPASCSDCYRLFIPGNNPMSLHPGAYTGVLAEVEFLSNPDVVEAFIMRPDSLDIIARGLLDGLRRYFADE